MSELTPQPDQPDGPAVDPQKSLEELLAEAQAKLEQQREAMLRAVAEADNARKRAIAEAANAHKYAVERFADSLLPVVDSLEAALASRDVSGVEITLRQLKAAFEKASLAEIAPAPGSRFDPNRHQAMAAVEAAQDPNTVVAVLQKGYSLGERVLRPALVTVAKGKTLENPGGNPISDPGTDPN